jgi:hypothetical protein
MNLILWVLTSLLVSFDSNAQKIFRYDSLYTSESGLSGEASFDYYLKDEMIIKTGEFRFKGEIKDEHLQTHLIKENWSGTYLQNRKHKNWNYNIQEYDVEIASISAKEIDYNVYLKESNFEVNYNSGKLEDDFVYERYLYKNDKKVKDLEKLNLSFSNHKVNGDVTYEYNDNGQSYSVRGKAYKGLMTGTWKFQDRKNKIVETRIYKNGVLMSLSRLQGKDTLAYLDFPLSAEIMGVIEGENSDFELADKPLSLVFSDGYPRNSKYIQEQQFSNVHLERFLELIFHFEPSINIKLGLILGTNRGYYPLDHDEKDYLKAWPDTEYNYRRAIQKTQDALVINRRFKDDSLMQVLKKWSDKQEELLDYIKPWNQILFKDQLEFYNRKGLVVDYARSVIEKDTIDLKDSLYVFNYLAQGEEPQDFLSYLITIIENRTAFADTLFIQVDERLGKLYLEDEVTFMNSEIINEKERTDSLYANTSYGEDLNKYADRISRHYLNGDFDERYADFITESSTIEQKELGQSILTRLLYLEEIHLEILSINSTNKFLDSLYTEYSFDPFTYSDRVPVRAKKRLYDIVADDMYNKLLEKLDPKHSGPDEILSQLQQIADLQKRLIFLRDKDTSKIERKLKSAKSLKERLEILQIE